MAKAKITLQLLERAIARDSAAVAQFVAILTPIFMYRIGRVLLRSRLASRAEIQDLCQDTFVALLIDDGRLARSWDPTRGLSFEGFSGLVAEQGALAFLRKRREELIGGDGAPDELEPATDSSRSPERLAMSRQLVARVYDVLTAELSDQGNRVFALLFLEEREVDEVCRIMQMKKSAVYQWRSRLAFRIHEIAQALGGAA